MSRQIRTRTLLCLLLVLPMLVIGGAASAFWSGLGHGDSTGGTGSPVAVTISPGTPTSDLSPGGMSDVVLTVSNPNLYPVRIPSLTLDTTQGTAGFAVDAGHSGCAVTTFGYTAQSNAGTGWTVAGRAGATNGTISVTLTNALSMSIDADNACQAAHATVYLKAGS